VSELANIFILAGVLMLAGEFAIPGYFMGAVGIAFVVAGGLMSLGIDSPFLVAGASILSGIASIVFFYWLGKRLTGHTRISVGSESFVGEIGVAKTDIKDGIGLIRVKGEEWTAHSKDTIKKGGKVKIIGHEGVHLRVEKV